MEKWTKALVRVGDGRGFVVGQKDQFVLTASHCLPQLPPCHPCSAPSERTFKLLGRLDGEPTIWTECIFANPVADLAILSAPDNQMYGKEWQDYIALTEPATWLALGQLSLARQPHIIPSGPTASAPAWIPALDGSWFRIEIVATTLGITIRKTEQKIVGGMSGSPMLLENGSAIGMVCTSGENTVTRETMISPGNPYLHRQLPLWFLEAIEGDE